MLKLNPSKKGLSISFRKKESNLSKAMIKGLLIALGFHLLLLFLFRIATSRYPNDTLPLSPASVDADLGGRPSYSKTSHQIFLTPLTPVESPTTPHLPKAAFHPYRGLLSLGDPDFTPLEKIPYTSLKEEDE